MTFTPQEMDWVEQEAHRRLTATMTLEEREATKRLVCEEAYERFRTPLLAGFRGATLEEAFEHWRSVQGTAAPMTSATSWQREMIALAQAKYFGHHRLNDSACTCNPCLADAGTAYIPMGAVPARPCQSCLPGWDGQDRCILGCWR